jgi:hypothetical protein
MHWESTIPFSHWQQSGHLALRAHSRSVPMLILAQVPPKVSTGKNISSFVLVVLTKIDTIA